MKRKAGFWIIISVVIAIATSISANNIPAGLFIGAGSSMLMMIITNLEVDHKKRN